MILSLCRCEWWSRLVGENWDEVVLICSRFCSFLLAFFSVCYSVIYECVTSGYKLLA